MKKADAFRHIVALRTTRPIETEATCGLGGGTGFFVRQDDTYYLVTAAHVALGTTLGTEVVVQNQETGMPLSIALHKLSPFQAWLYHPIADLAILKVKGKAPIDVSPYAIDVSCFANNFDIYPDRDLLLTAFGLSEIPDSLPFMPFTYDSFPSSDLWMWYYDRKGNNFKGFLLDKPAVQGYSGAPVLDLSGDTPYCYGIIHGTFGDNTGGKMTVVVHSAYLFELLDAHRYLFK